MLVTRKQGLFGGAALAVAASLFLGSTLSAAAYASDETDPATTESSVVSEANVPAQEPAATPVEATPTEPAPEANVTPVVTEDEVVVEEESAPAPAARVSNVNAVVSHDTAAVIKELEAKYAADSATCYAHGTGSSDHGSVTNNGSAVTLKPFNQSWPGDHWEALFVWGTGPDGTLTHHPSAGVAYTAPLAAGEKSPKVTDWVVCKGTTPTPPPVKPVVTLTGTEKCTPQGTYTVTWNGQISNYGTLSEVDLKVITHLPAGTLINGVDAQVWLYEWTEHSANHNLPAFPPGGTFSYVQSNIPGTATSASTTVQYDFKGGPSGDPVGTITLGGDCAPPPPFTCPAVSSGPVATDADEAGWAHQDTRPTPGTRHEYIDGAIRLFTNAQSSTEKSTLYRTVTGPMATFGEPTVEFGAGTGGKPGLQYGIDADGNGTIDGMLVGEPWIASYNNHWSLFNSTFGSAAQFVKDGAPHTGGGYGSQWHGTWDEWIKAFPNAQSVVLGLSLGSGVLGDWEVKSITGGCTKYTFDTKKDVVVPAAPVVTGEQKCTTDFVTGEPVKQVLLNLSNPKPTAPYTVTTEVTLDIVVDGKAFQSVNLQPGASLDNLEILFAEDSGDHKVEVFNGATSIYVLDGISSDCAPNEVKGTPDIKVVVSCGTITYTFSYTAVIGKNEFVKPVTFTYTDEKGATQEVVMEANDAAVTKTVTYAEDSGTKTATAGIKGGTTKDYTVLTDCVPAPPKPPTTPSGGIATDGFGADPNAPLGDISAGGWLALFVVFGGAVAAVVVILRRRSAVS